MDFGTRTCLLIVSLFFLTGMLVVCVGAFIFRIWLLGALLSLSTIVAFLPVGLCVKKWLAAKERRRLCKRENRRLKQAMQKYHVAVLDILMDFIQNKDIVNIIHDKYLGEVGQELIISVYNIKVKYLVNKINTF